MRIRVYTCTLNKSAGPDNLTTEHLCYGGNIVVTWLTEILNSIIELEQIPSPLKSGITIIPVYKGGGRDPLDVNSYRGITLNSVLGLYYIWQSNLLSTSMIEERILKARKAFFQFGSISAFQGNLSPVSISSVINPRRDVGFLTSRVAGNGVSC